MKNYIVYLDNGQILKTGVCNDSEFEIQGANVIEGFADDSCQYIENGQVVDMPAKPDSEAYFDFDAKQWVLDTAAQEQSVKLQRSRLLAESDWTQLPDVPLATKTAWAQYRQDLRDITTQDGYPFAIMWPVKPE